MDGVDLTIRSGEILGLVGESGCGKSITSLSIMRLIAPPGKVLEGEILLDGQNLLELPESEMMKVRGNRISMIFQQPQTALNPVFRAGDQIAEVLSIHQSFGKEAGAGTRGGAAQDGGHSRRGAPGRCPSRMSFRAAWRSAS